MNDDLNDVKTGNGVDRDLAATTNELLRKNIIESRGLNAGMTVLNTSIKNFSESSDSYSKKLFYLTAGLFIFTIVLVAQTYLLMEDAKEQGMIQNKLALNSAFFTETNIGIIGAMENNNPILIKNGGKYIDAQLSNYLDTFTDIESARTSGRLEEADLCESFSYFLNLTATSSEIKKYMDEPQNLAYFKSIPKLVGEIEESKIPDCH